MQITVYHTEANRKQARVVQGTDYYLVQGYRFRSDETWQDVELFPREYPLHNRGVAQNRADAFGKLWMPSSRSY